MVDLDLLVRDSHDLEPLPQSSVRLAGILSIEDWDLDAINEVVRLDEALTGRLLGAANSVRSGALAEITNVEQAIVRLGAATILSLAVGAAVRGSMERAQPCLGIGEGELWRHSVASALAIDLARDFVSRPVPPQAFATALLHDVGKLVLERHLDEHSSEFLQRARTEGNLSEQKAELEVLQISHAEIGALIVRSWGLPECIASGIQYHHDPLQAQDEEGRHLAYLIGMADSVAIEIGEACGESNAPQGLSPDVAGALGLPRAKFVELCEKTTEQLELVLEQYKG
ncbi:MAG: putative nucleotidyltransferase with HDIG domain [Planctomycetota bacterium]